MVVEFGIILSTCTVLLIVKVGIILCTCTVLLIILFKKLSVVVKSYISHALT